MFIVPKKGREPKTHIPIAILIDCSESAEDIRDLMDRSIRELLRQMNNKVQLRSCVELLVIQYNDRFYAPAKFEYVENIKPGQLDIRSCEGTTHTGMAILKALQMLRARRMEYIGKQEKCSKPLLFLFTDGYPDAGENAPKEMVEQVLLDYEDAAEQIKQMEKEDQLFFCAAGIQRKDGISADMQTLYKLSNYPRERIFQVIGDDNDRETVSKFCQKICEAAKAMEARTPPEEVLEDMI